MLLWVTIAAAVLLAAVVLGLVLPVTVAGTVSGGTEQGLRFLGRVQVFGGTIGCAVAFDGTAYLLSLAVGSKRWGRIPLTSLVGKAGKKKAPKKSPPTKEKRPLAERLADYRATFENVRPRIGEAWRDIWRIIRIDRFDAHVGYGIAGPALMGAVIGAVAFVNGLLPRPFSIAQSFDFTRRMVQGRLDAALTIRMHQLWWMALKYAPALIGLMRAQRKENSQQKQHVTVQEVV